MTWIGIDRDGGKEKDASRVKAMQLFPEVADQLSRKRDHGRADALLMAAWAQGIVHASRFSDPGAEMTDKINVSLVEVSPHLTG